LVFHNQSSKTPNLNGKIALKTISHIRVGISYMLNKKKKIINRTFILFSPLVAGSSMPLLARKATFFACANFHFLSASKSYHYKICYVHVHSSISPSQKVQKR